LSSRLQAFVGLRLAATLLLAAPLSCADFERGEPTADGGSSSPDAGGTGGDGGETLSFASDVHPLLATGCQPCHHTGGAAGDTTFILSGEASADFSTVSALVDTASPAQSRLLKKASGQGHGGGTVYAVDSPEYQTLLAWVSGGALP
jgi:hypothetical protein